MMTLRRLLTSPPRRMHPVLLYLLLPIFAVTSGVQVMMRLSAPPPRAYDLEGCRMAGSVLMLLCLVAFQLRWPLRVMVALRLLALGWLVYDVFYMWRVWL